MKLSTIQSIVHNNDPHHLNRILVRIFGPSVVRDLLKMYNNIVSKVDFAKEDPDLTPEQTLKLIQLLIKYNKYRYAKNIVGDVTVNEIIDSMGLDGNKLIQLAEMKDTLTPELLMKLLKSGACFDGYFKLLKGKIYPTTVDDFFNQPLTRYDDLIVIFNALAAINRMHEVDLVLKSNAIKELATIIRSNKHTVTSDIWDVIKQPENASWLPKISKDPSILTSAIENLRAVHLYCSEYLHLIMSTSKPDALSSSLETISPIWHNIIEHKDSTDVLEAIIRLSKYKRLTLENCYAILEHAQVKRMAEALDNLFSSSRQPPAYQLDAVLHRPNGYQLSIAFYNLKIIGKTSPETVNAVVRSKNPIKLVDALEMIHSKNRNFDLLLLEQSPQPEEFMNASNYLNDANIPYDESLQKALAEHKQPLAVAKAIVSLNWHHALEGRVDELLRAEDPMEFARKQISVVPLSMFAKTAEAIKSQPEVSISPNRQP